METQLRKARKDRGKTLIEVARAVNTDVGNLSRIEKGEQIPRHDLALRLYEYYHGDVGLLDILVPKRAADVAA